jgi:hypothetical protein
MTAIQRLYQSQKLERQDVWQLTTGVALSIGTTFIPSGVELIPSELEVEL